MKINILLAVFVIAVFGTAIYQATHPQPVLAVHERQPVH